MVRVFAAGCVGLLLGLVITPATGHAEDKKPQAPAPQYSKPVSAAGVEFEVAAQAVWQRPPEVYGESNANVSLRISNRSDKDFTFDLGDKLLVSLKSADGSELVSDAVPRRYLPKPLRVAAGKSETVMLPTYLSHTRSGAVCLGLDSGAGWNWLTYDLPKGKYRLSLSFENKQQGNEAWLGKMQTETLEIEVKGAK